jgi:4-diphosphocytidyl-2-C-methyl-D-erythritol kinase
MSAPSVTEAAPAKINLCLHVTGRRADGYHLLDSLVVFAGVSDRVTAALGHGLDLRITGPEAAGLSGEVDNLVLRAARVMGVEDAFLTLWKALPVASGIGGGSADAAAALRALSRMTGQPVPDAGAVLALGADVPVCLSGRPVRMQGVGEVLTPLPPLPPIWVVLVNPRVPVSTPRVFADLAHRENPAIPGLPAEGWANTRDLADWLATDTRNDLQAPAEAMVPAIAKVRAALAATEGCLLARMSGSGATTFGLFPTADEAQAAARRVRIASPAWWVAEAKVSD